MPAKSDSPTILRIPHPLLLLVGLAIVGALLLKLPVSGAPGVPMSWSDAFFLATAAACTTGLPVREPAGALSSFGLLVLALLVQLGAIVVLALGWWAVGDSPRKPVPWRETIVTLLGIEAILAAIMLPLWPGDLSVPQRLGWSLFHAISAFCNAGFSLVPGNLTAHPHALISHVAILPGIVLGGLGLALLHDLKRSMRQGTASLDPRTRQALLATAVVYLLGVCVLLIGQLMPQMYPMLKLGIEGQRLPPELSISRIGGLLADASFQSIAARSTGFATLGPDALQPASRCGLLVLMFIGGVPGGGAGGIGVTTAAAAFLAGLLPSAHATSSGAQQALHAAWTIVTRQLLLIVIATLLLCLSEPFPLEKLLFEVTSAASSAGLSLGITGSLTSFGKGVIIVTMLLGRVTPLLVLMRLAAGPGAR